MSPTRSTVKARKKNPTHDLGHGGGEAHQAIAPQLGHVAWCSQKLTSTGKKAQKKQKRNIPKERKEGKKKEKKKERKKYQQKEMQKERKRDINKEHQKERAR